MLRYQFRPSWFSFFVALLVISACIKLGHWQYDKASQKLQLQDQLDQAMQAAPVALPPQLDDVQAWRYRQVHVSGQYLPDYQILIDNQVHNERAGYHLLTPFMMQGTEQVVLVNRGWIAVGNDRRLPVLSVPQGAQRLQGQVSIPSNKYYTLESPQAEAGWQPLWQNLDLNKYAAAVPFSVLPVVLRLNPDPAEPGLVRDWPKPAERITTHIGYAYQWYGFAFTVFAIFLYLGFRRNDVTGVSDDAAPQQAQASPLHGHQSDASPSQAKPAGVKK